MITYALTSALFLLAALAAEAAPAVRFLALDGRSESSPLPPAVFGDSAQGLEIEIAGINASSASLRAAAFQTAGPLAMPLGPELDLQEGLSLSTTTPQRVHIALKVPRVSQQAKIIYRLSITSSTTAPAEIGEIALDVFPASLTMDFTDLLRGPSNAPPPVVVFGPGHQFRSILNALHVPFQEDGPAVPGHFDIGRLYFGELENDGQFRNARDRDAGTRLVIFSPDETLPPGVYCELSPSSDLVHVTLPLLDHFATDPRAQLSLIKIINLIFASSPSSTGESNP